MTLGLSKVQRAAYEARQRIGVFFFFSFGLEFPFSWCSRVYFTSTLAGLLSLGYLSVSALLTVAVTPGRTSRNLETTLLSGSRSKNMYLLLGYFTVHFTSPDPSRSSASELISLVTSRSSVAPVRFFLWLFRRSSEELSSDVLALFWRPQESPGMRSNSSCPNASLRDCLNTVSSFPQNVPLVGSHKHRPLTEPPWLYLRPLFVQLLCTQVVFRVRVSPRLSARAADGRP